jgi:hypothetical protein
VNREEEGEEQVRRRVAADGHAFERQLIPYALSPCIVFVVEPSKPTLSIAPFAQVAFALKQRSAPLPAPRTSLSTELYRTALIRATVLLRKEHAGIRTARNRKPARLAPSEELTAINRKLVSLLLRDPAYSPPTLARAQGGAHLLLVVDSVLVPFVPGLLDRTRALVWTEQQPAPSACFIVPSNNASCATGNDQDLSSELV